MEFLLGLMLGAVFMGWAGWLHSRPLKGGIPDRTKATNAVVEKGTH